MDKILEYLKNNLGECNDTLIAEATGNTLAKTRIRLAELAASREIMVCQTTRYEKGKKIEGMSCRISGFIPKAAPGAKSKKVNLKLS
jgi:hypothetical protein